jgi:hypothetical protein
MLQRGSYTLTCESSEGTEDLLLLSGVEATYAESPAAGLQAQRILTWHISSPSASRNPASATDTLDGPLRIQVKDVHGNLLGSGESGTGGPALRRVKDVWHGLAPLRWTQIDDQGKGDYLLPAGWRKEADDRIVIGHGPVVWRSAKAEIIHELTAASLVAKDFSNGIFFGVKASLVGEGALAGGEITAGRVETSEATLRFEAPVAFENKRGWHGTALEGIAIHSSANNSTASVDLKDFSASGTLFAERPADGHAAIFVRHAKANGVRWTRAGLQMEGNVQWLLSNGGSAADAGPDRGGIGADGYLLRAPRLFYRGAPGSELPANVALGTIRSEGYPVLEWGGRTLSSPTMTFSSSNRAWLLDGPVHGTVPGGTFSSGPAAGSPAGWEFTGPVRADYLNWGTLMGDRLHMAESQEPTYTFTGRPAVLVGFDRRLQGAKIIRRGHLLLFPNGFQGHLNYRGETMTLRADTAEISSPSDLIGTGHEIKEARLSGRVEGSAQGVKFSSKEATITFDSGNQPRLIVAKGGTALHGSLGSGFGETLELAFEPGKSQPTLSWTGHVRGKIEVDLER